jgi:hypothetical protein
VGGDGGAPEPFTITLPARADLVGTLRVFVSTVARLSGLADDLVEDLKLAISEACTDPIQAGAGGAISATLRDDGSGLVCEVTSGSWSSDDAAASTDLPEGIDPGALDRLQVVRALFSDAERVRRGDDVTLRFSTSSRRP